MSEDGTTIEPLEEEWVARLITLVAAFLEEEYRCGDLPQWCDALYSPQWCDALYDLATHMDEKFPPKQETPHLRLVK